MSCILNICMSGRTEEVERPNCILSIWMPEQKVEDARSGRTEEGELMTGILGIVDVRADRRR